MLGWREDCNLDKSSKILWDQQIHFPTFGRYVATGTSLKRWQKNSLLTTNRGVIFKEKIILSWNSRDIFEAYGLYVNYTFIQKNSKSVENKEMLTHFPLILHGILDFSVIGSFRNGSYPFFDISDHRCFLPSFWQNIL